MTITTGDTSHTAFLTLHGCIAPGGTVTTTLLQGITTVATATAQITVTEVNNAPAFDPSAYSFSVAEDAATDHITGTVTATDDDTDDTLTYSITVGNTSSVFSIDPFTGQIAVAGALDYETTLLLHADGGGERRRRGEGHGDGDGHGD